MLCYYELMSHKKLAKYLVYQFAVLFFSVILAIFIKPEGLNANNGVSYYFVQIETALVVTIGFCTASFLSFYAGWRLNPKTKLDKTIRTCLFIAAVCYVGLVLTPHDVIAQIHKTFGSSLFGLDFLLAYFCAVALRKRLDILLFLITYFSGMMCLVYLFVSGYMIQAQLIFQLAAWTLYIRYLLRKK